MLDRPNVALWDAGVTAYPQTPPFHPAEAYPEYPFGDAALGPSNGVYRAVREMLHALGLDTAHFGTPQWNPLGELVRPGHTVVLKPNFVISEHPDGQPGIEAAVVHGSVLRPLIDYVYLALKGRGRILVADSPIKEVDFQRIVELTGIAAVKSFYDTQTSLGLELMDFRDLYVERDAAGFMASMQRLAGDPTGYTEVDLGQESMFHDVSEHLHRLRSTAVYYEDVMDQFHNQRRNVYSIPNTLLNANVVISVSKLKTHRKGGVTMSLKNAVGITNEKRGLPHHRVGSPHDGGDAMPDNARLDARLEDSFRDFMLSHHYGRAGLRVLGAPLRTVASHLVKPLFRRIAPEQPAIVEGDWYGNDTVWRMALDLNRALFFADPQGGLANESQRGYFSVIDGIVAGEGEGPLFPTPKPCGALIAGWHPVLTDIAAARLMGFDWRKIPMLREAVQRNWPLRPPTTPDQIAVYTNRVAWGKHDQGPPAFRFEPSRGWKGHVEQTRD